MNIKQIQEYNRKKILIASIDTLSDYEKILNIIQDYFPEDLSSGKLELLASELDLVFTKPKLTLNRVLLALNERSDFRCSISGGEIEIFGYIWDLKKETLEEQIEYLQRGVYKLLGGGEWV